MTENEMNNQAAQTMPEPVTASMCPSSDYAKGWNDCLAAMLAAAPAASGGEDKGDPVCHEDDGCPTEGAVLKRFWRSLNTDDTKQLMAFYGVADVAALIEQQVQHVQSLQIKLKAHEPKRDQFPKSPREG